MLRVGLTGELGSGKSSVARALAARGAIVLSSDEIARVMMQPGGALFEPIVERFGIGVLDAEGCLDRGLLARLAFDPAHPRVEELNALVHPPVLAAQEEQVQHIRERQPDAIVIVESALIFSAKVLEPGAANTSLAADAETVRQPWRTRFDCIVVVTAPRALKLARFVQRASPARELSEAEREAIAADAERRLDLQAKTVIPEDGTILRLANEGSIEQLVAAVDGLWLELQQRARQLG